MKLCLLYLTFGIAYAQSVFPVTTTSISFALAPTATGTSTADLIPFDIDFTSLPGYQNISVLLENLSSTWTSEITVYDDSENFDSFLSLSWPDGEGPGASAVGQNNTWNACLITLPTLFEQLNITDAGNGSCFDVVQSECLYYLLSTVMSSWDSSISGQTNLSDAALEGACQRASSNIPHASECFGQSADWTQKIQGYWTTNPTKGEPFLLGVEAYNASGVTESKSDIQKKVLSKIWPLIILEAEGSYSVQATMTCPHAGNA